jgi:hypothetical protein
MFKIGDKVRVVNNPLGIDIVKDHMGIEGIIVNNHFGYTKFDYLVKFTPPVEDHGDEIYFNSDELELVNKNQQLTFIFHD